MNSRILLTFTALGVLASAGMFYTSSAQAQEIETNKYSPLIQKLIDKLGLKSEDVDPVISEFQLERKAEMQKAWSEKIKKLVSENKITQEQANKWIEKQAEWREREKPSDWRDLSAEERRSKMEARRSEHEQWFKDNGIDVSLMQEMGFQGRGFGGKHSKWSE